jgi:DNA-binding NarL/FixJ family response regulator
MPLHETSTRASRREDGAPVAGSVHRRAATITSVTGRGKPLDACRVVVAERHDVFRIGLVETVRRIGPSVVAHVEGGMGLARLAAEQRADVVLIGGLDDLPVSDVVASCKRDLPDVRLVHLATVTERDEYVRLLKAGTDAIVPVTADRQALTDMLDRVVSGQRVFSGTALAAVRTELAELPASDAGLTKREREVLGMLATRRTMAEIAGELFLSRSTVKSHVARVYSKLSATDRHDAVERAVSLKLLG